MLKTVMHLILFVGLVLSCFGTMGFFKDQERIGLYEKIFTGQLIGKETDGFDKFVKSFPVPADRDGEIIGLKTNEIGADGSGGNGLVHYKLESGRAIHASNQADIRAWAHSDLATPFIFGLSFLAWLVSFWIDRENHTQSMEAVLRVFNGKRSQRKNI